MNSAAEAATATDNLEKKIKVSPYDRFIEHMETNDTEEEAAKREAEKTTKNKEPPKFLSSYDILVYELECDKKEKEELELKKKLEEKTIENIKEKAGAIIHKTKELIQPNIELYIYTTNQGASTSKSTVDEIFSQETNEILANWEIPVLEKKEENNVEEKEQKRKEKGKNPEKKKPGGSKKTNPWYELVKASGIPIEQWPQLTKKKFFESQLHNPDRCFLIALMMLNNIKFETLMQVLKFTNKNFSAKTEKNFQRSYQYILRHKEKHCIYYGFKFATRTVVCLNSHPRDKETQQCDLMAGKFPTSKIEVNGNILA